VSDESSGDEVVIVARWHRRYGVWNGVLWTVLAVYRASLDQTDAWDDTITWVAAALAVAWWVVGLKVGIACDDTGVRAKDRLTRQPTVPWEEIRGFRVGSWPNGIQAQRRDGTEVRLADRGDAERVVAALEAERRRRLGIPTDDPGL
jgi:hypothetical protein